MAGMVPPWSPCANPYATAHGGTVPSGHQKVPPPPVWADAAGPVSEAIAAGERAIAARRSLKLAPSGLHFDDRVLHFMYLRDGAELPLLCDRSSAHLYRAPWWRHWPTRGVVALIAALAIARLQNESVSQVRLPHHQLQTVQRRPQGSRLSVNSAGQVYGLVCPCQRQTRAKPKVLGCCHSVLLDTQEPVRLGAKANHRLGGVGAAVVRPCLVSSRLQHPVQAPARFGCPDSVLSQQVQACTCWLIQQASSFWVKVSGSAKGTALNIAASGASCT